jgi:LPS sulfotransferase NodH
VTRWTPDGRPVDSYFVCATPRTGSSLLLGLLDSTGVAGRPQAYFRGPDEPLWAERWRLPHRAGGVVDYARYVRAARVAGSTGNGVFGAKLMWGTLDELLGKLATGYPDLAGRDVALLTRAFGRTGFVHLRRDDVVAQAVSWLRAEQTGEWFVGGNGEIGGAGGGGQPPRFDAERLDRLVRTVEEHDAAWRTWFAAAGVRPHRVRYEELRADPVGVTRGVLADLGLDLPAGAVVAPRHARQSDELNAEWERRYRAAHRPSDAISGGGRPGTDRPCPDDPERPRE